MALSNPILILLLLVTARCAVAQPSPSSLTNDDKDLYGQNFNAATAILIVVIVSAFFFLAFFSVYFRRCSRDRSAVVPASGIAASRLGARRGLDPAVIETFPTLTYSAVTGLKIGKETLECAVCLSEFSDDETLRMLPKCCHVFHPECIDTWLASHVTCPVCRDNLSVVPADLEVGPEIPAPEETDGTGDSSNHRVDVADDLGVNRIMGRSHTVGHVSGGTDRFTLRLPEHVRREIVAAGSLRRSASVAVFRGGGEGSTRRGYRGRSGGMWAGLSDRWASGILARVSTWRRGEGEGSLRRGEAAEGSMRGGMFDCLSGGGGGGGGGGDGGESSSRAVDNDEEAPMKVLSRV